MKETMESIIILCTVFLMLVCILVIIISLYIKYVIKVVKIKDVKILENGLIYYDNCDLYDNNFYKYIDYKDLPFLFKFNNSYNELCNYYINHNKNSVIKISKLELKNYE